MSRSLDDLLPEAKVKALQLLDECERQGILIFVTSTLRTFFDQDELFAQGRTRPGLKVTNARGGESNHNHGRAFDVAFKMPPAASLYGNENPWGKVGDIGEGFDLAWGGRWRTPDRPHFELPKTFRVHLRRAASIGRLRRGRGASERNVQELQKALTASGYPPGSADGDFGPKTEGAVQDLQRANGILPSGIVHPRELEILGQKSR